MSRLALAREYTQRPSLHARLLFQGPAGSGKTLSALKAATVLAAGGPILGIDTESGEMLCYRDEYQFTHLDWQPPYDPSELAAVVIEAGGDYAAVVIDSSSHFWSSDGGTLAVAEGKFTGWKEARPVQRRFMESLKRTRSHVVLCARTKTEWAVDQDSRSGKQKITRMGTAPVQDATLDYEMNVSVDVGTDHSLTVLKSRTLALPVGRTYGPDSVVEFAETYAGWLAGGEPLLSEEELSAVRAELDGLTDPQKLWASNHWREQAIPALATAHASDLDRIMALIATAATVEFPVDEVVADGPAE